MLNPMKYHIVGLMSDILKSLGIRGYLVGGAVRDMLLGIEPVDFDFTVECSPEEHFMLCCSIEERLNCSVSYNNWYHTGKFHIDGFEADIVMAREEYYDRIAAKPVVKAAGLYKDLARRDFTINTMAIPIYDENEDIIDHFDGISDLKSHRIKVLHGKSFRDDPTRIFRGIKYASRFYFNFDENTCELIDEAVRMGYIGYLKPGRIKQELLGILNEPNPVYAVGIIKRLDILKGISNVDAVLNDHFDDKAFGFLKDNKKLSAILYKISNKEMDALKNSLNLSMDVVNHMQQLKELSNLLLLDDDYIYRYMITNEKRLDWKLVKTVFYDDKRIYNFFRLKDDYEVYIDKKIIRKPEEIHKYIIEEKLKRLKMILMEGEKNNV